jgi:hypothetical protein
VAKMEKTFRISVVNSCGKEPFLRFCCPRENNIKMYLCLILFRIGPNKFQWQAFALVVLNVLSSLPIVS